MESRILLYYLFDVYFRFRTNGITHSALLLVRYLFPFPDDVSVSAQVELSRILFYYSVLLLVRCLVPFPDDVSVSVQMESRILRYYLFDICFHFRTNGITHSALLLVR